MIEGQEGALRALDNYVIALVGRIVHQVFHRAYEGLELGGPVATQVEHLSQIDGFALVAAGNDGVVMLQHILKPRMQRLQIQ